MNFDTAADEAIPLVENFIDIPRDTLDPTVFQFFDDGNPPILRDGLKAQILTDIQTFSGLVPVTNFYIVGAILTTRWTPDCDIDINVEADPQIMDSVSVAEVLFHLNRINGRFAIGTQHPINYYVIPGEADYEKLTAIYDIVNERWIKQPDPLNPEIDAFLTRFNETILSIDLTSGKIRRNLVDLEELKELGKENVETVRFEVQRKLDVLEENIQYLSSIYRDARVLRRMAYDKTLTPVEIRFYGKKENLPENVVMKLLEKCYILKFIKRIDAMLDENVEYDIENLVHSSRIGREFGRA